MRDVFKENNIGYCILAELQHEQSKCNNLCIVMFVDL